MAQSHKERHPNSPLVEVAFEIKFPGETAIESRRHEIQDMLREKYPRLWVPHAKEGRPLALTPYRFEREDQTAGVMVSINNFAYYTRDYEGFDYFRNEVFLLIRKFEKLINVKKLNRVGLRYINIIPFVREGGLIPIDRFFVLGQKLVEFFPECFENFKTAFALPQGNGTVMIRIEQLVDEYSRQEAFLLDFDYSMTEKLILSELDKYMDRAHDYTKALFGKLITNEYHDYIEGKEV